jgi:hypothetical protein
MAQLNTPAAAGYVVYALQRVVQTTTFLELAASLLLRLANNFFLPAMVTPRKTAALRRMKLEELITKMEQIEEQAALTLHEYAHAHTRERQRLVMAIAKQVRAHLIDQLEAGARESLANEREVKVRVIDADKSLKSASSN